ncbi:MAG: TetR/AcrR family transcriptional regulator, partial [Actinomycetia bacterium]|nr:TetR/AcrR family transcriptional regulator [Actinomycetes bacterium]
MQKATSVMGFVDNLHNVVQKTARRGRPPKFDHNAVVDAAIGAFFRSGFEATTLADLEHATGVDRSTLYNSFGGKQGLYELATTAYLERAETSLFEPLANG